MIAHLANPNSFEFYLLNTLPMLSLQIFHLQATEGLINASKAALVSRGMLKSTALRRIS